MPCPESSCREAGAALAILAVIILGAALLGCQTAPTPEQVNAYANAAHTVVHGAVQDYKQVAPLIRR